MANRRAEQIEKAPPEPTEGHLVRRGRGKKNRRRWCRGKIDVEHDPVWIKDSRRVFPARNGMVSEDSEFEWQNYECRNCGKILDWRQLHLACGEAHPWGAGYYFWNSRTRKAIRKPFPCEEGS